MPPRPKPQPPFGPNEIRQAAPIMEKIQQAAESEGRLLVLDPTEARLLRRLLYHLQHRKK